MKKTAFILLSIVAFLIIILLIRSIKLDIFVPGKNKEPKELTLQEKTEDVAYFFQFIKDSYPFVESIEKEKDLDNFYELKNHYFERVKASRTNREFVRIIGEMVQRLEHGTAHCDIVAPGGQENGFNLWSDCFVYNISKKAFLWKNYWWEQLDRNSRWHHAELNTMYTDGNYVVTDTFKTENQIIPEGSIIRKINGLSVIDYVKSLQHLVWLRFDVDRKSVFCNNSPFIVDMDTTKDNWFTELELPNGVTEEIKLAKKKGYKPPADVPFPEENLTLAELDEKTGYIKVMAFTRYKDRQKDFAKIDSFFDASHGKYKKLIIDLRNNLGGAPAYWQDIFIKRLIDKPLKHEQYSIVKKEVFNKLNFNRRLFNYKYRKEIDLGKLTLLEPSEWPFDSIPEYLNPDEFYFVKNTQTYTPTNKFPFDGEIYLLTDHNTFSAAEDFSKASKELDFATLVGANTIGGAAVSFAPWLFELPNSHILMNIEIDMAFNPDGSINEIYGTKPDHQLEPSTFPTSMPSGYDVKSLLNDKWIQYVMRL